ncbi:MAG: dihydrolipoyl dehydrogenase [Phycisphaerae bacterium]
MVVGELTQEVDLLVIGGGPGGYVAAAHAADLGINTGLVEAAEVPGGVCLREGCIPSKALLHVAKIISEAAHAEAFGVAFSRPTIDLDKLRSWKNGVIRRLATGVSGILKGRKIETFVGRATFENSRTVRIEGGDVARVKFKHCIIATGSSAKRLPERVLPRELCWDAAEALALAEVPRRLLVVGGGYIGLELGQVYASLGSAVTVIEALETIAPGGDPELIKPLAARLAKQFAAIHTGATLKGARRAGGGIEISFAVGGQDKSETFDRVLVSVGRKPNSDGLGLETTKVTTDERGFIKVDAQRRSSDPRIFAIGDVAGEPMLAHKASREGKVAAEAIAGKPTTFDPTCIPAVIYTDPEVAWCGITEKEAAARGIAVKIARFPWVASGRAVSMGRTDGLTKLIFDAHTRRLIGAGLVGAHAGDLVSEIVLGVEMAAVADDLALSIHPHPATSETIMEAAEAAFGHAVHGGH